MLFRSGDYTILLTKSIIDGITIMIFASSMGKGAVFSAFPLIAYQGAITLLARWVEPFITEEITASISLVGSVMIFALGVNIAFGKKFKVSNMLPALLVSVVYVWVRKFI